MPHSRRYLRFILNQVRSLKAHVEVVNAPPSQMDPAALRPRSNGTDDILLAIAGTDLVFGIAGTDFIVSGAEAMIVDASADNDVTDGEGPYEFPIEADNEALDSDFLSPDAAINPGTGVDAGDAPVSSHSGTADLRAPASDASICAAVSHAPIVKRVQPSTSNSPGRRRTGQVF